MTGHERNLVRRSERFARANEYAHDQTHQRRFERAFLSLDRPDEDGNMYDYGDNGRAMRRTLRGIDAPYRERIRDMRFTAAIDMLDGHPALVETLLAVRRYRRRRRIAAALGIHMTAYVKRFARICQPTPPPSTGAAANLGRWYQPDDTFSHKGISLLPHRIRFLLED